MSKPTPPKPLKPGERKLIDKAMTVSEMGALEAEALGFSTRVLVQACLPHRNPGNDLRFWERTNGNFSLVIQPGIAKGEVIGYPYGNIPRLILLYLTTQVIQTRQREISLGNSLSAFMGSIGLEVSGGRWGTITRFKEQVQRLFAASISFSYDDGQVFAHEHRPISRRTILWWDEKAPDQQFLFGSSVLLDESFYEEILKHPVPLDLRTVEALKQSPLALDLYSWLAHRVSYLDKPTRVPWESIQAHIGSDYSDAKDFRKKALALLRRIHLFWPDLRIEAGTGALILKPCKPPVAKTIVQVQGLPPAKE